MHVTRLRRGQPLDGPPLRGKPVKSEEERVCRRCGSSGPLVADSRKPNTFQSLCLACQNETYKIRYATRKDVWAPAKSARAKELYRENIEVNRARVRNAKRELAVAALNYLGSVCCMCGETDTKVLHIDHINGGGGAERRQGIFGPILYRSILRGERNGELQILCANCHRIKQKEGHPEPAQGSQRYYRNRLRGLALAHLGGKCCHCDLDDLRVLEIDHIQGDGAEDRNGRKRSGSIFVVKLVLADKEGGRYQLLCANCNWRKRMTNHEYNHHSKAKAVEEL